MARVDTFSIITLIAATAIIIFLIIAAVYFNNEMNFQVSSQGQATFLFWTSLVLIIVIVALCLYSIYRIFTYRPTVYIKEKPLQTVVDSTPITKITRRVPTAPVRQDPPILVSSVQSPSVVGNTIPIETDNTLIIPPEQMVTSPARPGGAVPTDLTSQSVDLRSSARQLLKQQQANYT